MLNTHYEKRKKTKHEKHNIKQHNTKHTRLTRLKTQD